MASDGLAAIRKSDSGECSLQKKQRNIFCYKNRFLVCAQGLGYINGIPYSYYVNWAFRTMASKEFSTTEEFCVGFKTQMAELLPQGERIMFYIAGMDQRKDLSYAPKVLLLDEKGYNIVNQGRDGESVYNFHSAGCNHWVSKMLLPTVFDPEQGPRVEFEKTDIDFSKYSLNEAIDFGKSMIEISCTMDRYVQTPQNIGEYVSIGCVTCNNEIIIKDLYE